MYPLRNSLKAFVFTELIAVSNSKLAEFCLECSISLALFAQPTPFIQAKAKQWLGWLPKRCHTKTTLGFTLAEVLITLLILAEIATFTIPKVLYSAQSTQSNAIAKETAGMIAGAFSSYQYSGGSIPTMSASALTSYFNYLKMDTSSLIDDQNTWSSITCSSSKPCFRLANGAMIHHWGDNFCNSTTATAIPFDVDPDGVYGGLTNGPSKTVRFFLYSNGRITTEGTLDSNTQWANNGTSTCNNTRSAQPANDPTWFSW